MIPALRTEIARLKKLDAERTQGEWFYAETRHHAQNQYVNSAEVVPMDHGRTVATVHITAWKLEGKRDARPNAKALAAAVNSLPAWLKLAERLIEAADACHQPLTEEEAKYCDFCPRIRALLDQLAKDLGLA